MSFGNMMGGIPEIPGNIMKSALGDIVPRGQQMNTESKSDFDRYSQIKSAQNPVGMEKANFIPQHISQPMPAQPSPQPRPTQEQPQPSIPQPTLNDNVVKPISTEKPQLKDLSLDNQLDSDDPEVFSNAIEELGTLDTKKALTPGSSTEKMFTQANQKYGRGQDNEGNQVYECPLTKKPCSRKTFWTRLKEFFQSLTGIKSREEAVNSVIKLDNKDPLTKKFSSMNEQPQAKTSIKNAWQQPSHLSGYKGAL